MRKHALALVLGIVVTAIGCAPAAPSSNTPTTTKHSVGVATSATASASTVDGDGSLSPPVAHREPKTETLHGQKRVDDYFWLRKRDSPEVLSYLAAENAYTHAMTKASEPFQTALYDEMLARIKETDDSPPVKEGAWLYYTRTEKGKQYPIHCRKRTTPAAKEDVLLDLNEMAKGEKFMAVDAVVVSDDGNLLAYSVDTQGYRQFTLQVKNLQTGVVSKERIPRVDAVAFARDNKTIFYVTEDATTKRPNQLHRHSIGDDPTKDALVYEEKDEMFDLDAARSRSREFVVVTSQSKTTSEVRVINATKFFLESVISV